MIPELRKKFNEEFSQSAYDKFSSELNSSFKYPADFRVSETPIFLSPEFKDELIKACEEILGQIISIEFLENSKNSVPEKLFIPNETDHPEFLQIDFAVTRDPEGKLLPKLVELQGFPSLYAYQFYLQKMYRKHYAIDRNLTTYFSGLTDTAYSEKIKSILLADSNPENVVLVEIYPDKQKTRIDFSATEKLFGISTVSITNVKEKDSHLYYSKNGKDVLIKRIYNRVIFDELIRKNVKVNFDIKKNLKVKWLPHPNWFFKISKHSLPFLKGKYVSNSYYLDRLNKYPENLNNYVLKPLFSFAGYGVIIDLNKDILNSLVDKQNYILQEKIEYAPVIETLDEPAKVEIRMMFVWEEEPLLVNNLVRLSKGKMMGVDYNKNKSWVGSSIAFYKSI